VLWSCAGFVVECSECQGMCMEWDKGIVGDVLVANIG
jgi:hypothetical protein